MNETIDDVASRLSVEDDVKMEKLSEFILKHYV